MRGKIREGDYQFNVIVYDRYWKREVQSSVTVKVREIGDEAVFNSGSIRLTGRIHGLLTPSNKVTEIDEKKVQYINLFGRIQNLISLRILINSVNSISFH